MDYEFYETPQTFSRWLFETVKVTGRCFAPCVGNGAIIRASRECAYAETRTWITNDLDPMWPADFHGDAATAIAMWERVRPDWTIENPPFTRAVEIIDQALKHSRVGVAMHLRASIHEVLKTGPRRTFMRQHPPNGILWLPRFAYQRSKSTGKWTTDNVCACWVVWLKGDSTQLIRYAPEWVLDALEAETPAYRERMDALMGYRGTEEERQAQRIAAARRYEREYGRGV